MTYSRPGIRGVNVRPGRQIRNTPTISIPSRGATVTPNAPYRDNRSPRQAAENVAIRNQGINNLLEFAGSEQVRNVVVEEIDSRARKEAQRVIDAYPATDITKGGNPQADAALNALSPRAKDFVVQARTAAAIEAYQPALIGELAARPILTAAGNTPEQQELRAQAFAEAQTAARDASGLSALPPFQLAKNAQVLAQVDGSVRGKAYAARIGKESDLSQVGLMEGGAAALSEAWRGIQDVAATDAAGGEAEVVGLQASFEQLVSQLGQNYGPTGQAKILMGAIVESANRITDDQERVEYLQSVQRIAQAGIIGADNDTDIFSVKISGLSIKDKLYKILPGEEALAEKGMLADAQREMFQRSESGDSEGALQLGMQYLELLDDPQSVASLIRSIKNLQKEETEIMRQNGYAMKDRLLDGEDAVALYKEMIGNSSDYSAKDIERMFTIAQTGGGDPQYRKKRQEFEYEVNRQPEVLSTGFAQYLRETVAEELQKKAFDDLGKLTNEGKEIMIAYETEVRAKFFELEENADPKTWDPALAFQEANKQVIGARKKRMVADAGGRPVTAKDSYISWAQQSLTALGQVSASNGGRIPSEKIPVEAISPPVMEAWQQENPGKSFESLTGQQREQLLVRSIQTFKRFDAATQEYVDYSEKEAKQRAASMLKEAERRGAQSPAPVQERVPEMVPETPEELKQSRRPGVQGYGQEPVRKALRLLEKAAQWSTTPQEDPFNFNKIYNNGGFGPQAMSYVDSFLNMAVGAAPAAATGVTYGTPEGLEELRQSWKSGQQGLNTGPMPQVAASTPVRYAPIAITNDKHELFVMVGVAEGTRTPSGGYTKAYYGHTDPGDGNFNRGTVSGGRGTNASPQMVDRQWMGTLSNVQQRMRPVLISLGLEPGTQGFNRVMFNLIDLTVQAPLAARDFAGKLSQVKQSGWTIEAIAKARADSFFSPTTGRLDAPGFGNSYQRLFQDQRSRAGVYDYRRRL